MSPVTVERHPGAVGGQRHATTAAGEVALHAGVGGGGEGDVAGAQVLDVDVEFVVGIAGVEVGGDRDEGDLGTVDRERGNVAVGVALDPGVGGGRQRDVAGHQVLHVDVGEGVRVAGVEVGGTGDERHPSAVC
jgi:hypothetical protein